ncbi:hypothetical protein BV20DRAFT_982762 [Pilatotrama ljubarskyi]|nr:hypothetical protein BV20DRAFT_982762 [Pilatotrama ljubarskyi]
MPRTVRHRAVPVTVTRLRATLKAGEPFCSSTLQLPPKDLEIYYGREAGWSRSKWMRWTNSRRHANLLRSGETRRPYLTRRTRKAGKMDAEHFMTRFDVRESWLLSVLRAGLLTGGREVNNIRAELYMLNIHGKGASFKPHKDTPRGENMFGSLVVVFPTPHEGGQLVLRKEKRSLLTGLNDRIAHIAFFSDVEHEVLPVLSGHRVTLTYNLYIANEPDNARPKGLTILHPLHSNPNAVKDALVAFLNDPKVPPRGGMLGFWLRPFQTTAAPHAGERGQAGFLDRMVDLNGMGYEEMGVEDMLESEHGPSESGSAGTSMETPTETPAAWKIPPVTKIPPALTVKSPPEPKMPLVMRMTSPVTTGAGPWYIG